MDRWDTVITKKHAAVRESLYFLKNKNVRDKQKNRDKTQLHGTNDSSCVKMKLGNYINIGPY